LRITIRKVNGVMVNWKKGERYGGGSLHGRDGVFFAPEKRVTDLG
jgi:hypothetical protein